MKYYFRLFDIKTDITEEECEILNKFLAEYDKSIKSFITVSKAKEITQIDEKKIINIFSELSLNGVLKEEYAIVCPECGHFIAKIDMSTFDKQSIRCCYECNEEIELTENDIIVLFVLLKSSFYKGRHSNIGFHGMEHMNVAPCDNINYLKKQSEIFLELLDISKKRFDFEEKERSSNSIVSTAKNIAYQKYSKNKKIKIFIKIMLLFIYSYLLLYIISDTGGSGVASGLINVCVFVFAYLSTNIVDYAIETDLNMLEKKEVIKSISINNKQV